MEQQKLGLKIALCASGKLCSSLSKQMMIKMSSSASTLLLQVEMFFCLNHSNPVSLTCGM